MTTPGFLFKETLGNRKICHNSQQKYSNTDDRNFDQSHEIIKSIFGLKESNCNLPSKSCLKTENVKKVSV